MYGLIHRSVRDMVRAQHGEDRWNRISDHESLLHYVSTRQGLTPFVVGLLKGLAVEFGDVIDIEIKSETQSDAGQRTTFLLKRP
jgi:hypothetical protein